MAHAECTACQLLHLGLGMTRWDSFALCRSGHEIGEGQGRRKGGNALLLLFTVLASPPLSARNTRLDHVDVQPCRLQQAAGRTSAFLEQAHADMRGRYT